MKRKNNPAVASIEGSIHSIKKWPAAYAVQHPISGGGLYVDFFRNADEAIGWAMRKSIDWTRCDVYGRGNVVMASFQDGKLIGGGGSALNYRHAARKRNPVERGGKKRNPATPSTVKSILAARHAYGVKAPVRKEGGIWIGLKPRSWTALGKAEFLDSVVNALASRGIHAEVRSTGVLIPHYKSEYEDPAEWNRLVQSGAIHETDYGNENTYGTDAQGRAVWCKNYPQHGRSKNPRRNPGLGDYWAAGKRAAAGAVASAAESARVTVEAAKRAAADEAAKVRVQPLTEEQAIRFLAKQHGIINPRNPANHFTVRFASTPALHKAIAKVCAGDEGPPCGYGLENGGWSSAKSITFYTSKDSPAGKLVLSRLARFKTTVSNPKKKRNPADKPWALAKRAGFDDNVVSMHATREDAEAALKKKARYRPEYGDTPQSVGYVITKVGKGAPGKAYYSVVSFDGKKQLRLNVPL